MGVVNSQNRRKKPNVWQSSVYRLFLECAVSNPEEMEKAAPGYWEGLFDCFTYPTEIQSPKAILTEHSSWLKSYSVNDMYEDWPDDWCETLAETFMFPEYQKD